MIALEMKRAIKEALQKEFGFSPLSRQVIILKATPKYIRARVEGNDWYLDLTTNRIRKESKS